MKTSNMAATVRSHRRRGGLVGTGLAAGPLQGAPIALLQLIPSIRQDLGLSPHSLGWLVTLSMLVPMLASVTMALGDWLGGRAIILTTAVLTALGLVAVAAGGVASSRGAPGFALALVIGGAAAVPAAMRIGDMVVVHSTRGHEGSDQLRRGGVLRAMLVVALYSPLLVAGAVAQAHGWSWVFAGYAVMAVACVAVLWRQVETGEHHARPPLRRLARDMAATVADGWLLLSAAGAVLARIVVFAFLTGLPIVLLASGHRNGVPAVVTACALLAAPLVLVRSGRWFMLVAGAVPLAAVLVVLAGDLAGRRRPAALLVALAIASALVELTKQWSQLAATVQARVRGDWRADYRRQSVISFGGSLGAVAGVGLGGAAAQHGSAAWIGLLLATAVGGLVLQAVLGRHVARHSGLARE